MYHIHIRLENLCLCRVCQSLPYSRVSVGLSSMRSVSSPSVETTYGLVNFSHFVDGKICHDTLLIRRSVDR